MFRIPSSLATTLFVAFVVLLTRQGVLSNGLLTSASVVVGNVSLSSQPLPVTSTSALSERSINTNPRYLSAASTAASLAVAQVAAQNGANLQSQQQQLSQSSVNSADSQRHFSSQQSQPQQTQQHQQQQPQQQQSSSSSSSASNQNNNNNHNQNQQSLIQQQTPSSASTTPILSTTFTYNPLINQLVPSELATGVIQTPSASSQTGNQFLPQTYSNSQQLLGSNQPLGSQLVSTPSLNQLAASLSLLQPQLVQSLLQQTPAQQFQLQLQSQQQQQPFNKMNNPLFEQTMFNKYQQQPFYGATNQPTVSFLTRPNIHQFIRRNGQQLSTGGKFNNINNNDDDFIGSQNSILSVSLPQQQTINPTDLISGVFDSNNFQATQSQSQSQSQQPQTQILEDLLANSASSISSNHLTNIPFQVQLPSSLGASSISNNNINSLTTNTNSGTSSNNNNNNNILQQPNGGQSTLVEIRPNGDQCFAADGRRGTCYLASECMRRGGTPMGKCGGSFDSSSVCCLFDVTCGQFVAERVVYFRNPNFPNTFESSRMCRARIGKLDKSICQLRLDMLRFDIAKPTNGNCSHDTFVVTGQNENNVMPKICGLNDGQHYHVGVDESGVITLHMMMMGYYRRNFEIMVTQIPCKSDFAAPSHCLQYFMGTHGTIKSFNYDDPSSLLSAQQSSSQVTYDDLVGSLPSNINQGHHSSLSSIVAPYNLQMLANQPFVHQHHSNIHNQNQNQLQQRQASRLHHQYQETFGGYPNDLDYTMCIRKESGFCSITYQLSRNDNQAYLPFAVGSNSNFLVAHNDSIFGLPSSALTTPSWLPVSSDCRDDFLLVAGMRLCSGSLTSSSPSSTSFVDYQVPGNGQNLSTSGSSPSSQLQHIQQLEQQRRVILYQLLRLQNSSNNNNNNNNINNNNNNNNNTNNNSAGNNSNLEQQQAALMQQLSLVLQQINNSLPESTSTINNVNSGHSLFSGPQTTQQITNTGLTNTQNGAILTDTTTGPFSLRFVSNLSKNAKGFQIDYRQNPCK